jgi:hypothetical protein
MKRSDEAFEFRKVSKKIILIFLSTISLNFAKDLEFFLSFEKETVYVCEDVEARLVAKNLSKKQLKLETDEWEDNLRIIVVAPSGNTLPNLFPHWGDDFQNKYLTLQPKDSLVRILGELYESFSLPLQSSTGIVYNGFPGIGLPPGTYQMKVRWGKILSNVVEFTVKQPEGKLVKAYDLYLEAFAVEFPETRNFTKNHYIKADLKNIIPQLKKIVTELGKNNYEYLLEPYGPKTYSFLISELFCAGRDSEGLASSKFLIENFPNSKSAKWWLFSGTLRKKTKDFFNNDFLQYINEKFPNTLVGEEAHRILESKKEKPEK